MIELVEVENAATSEKSSALLLRTGRTGLLLGLLEGGRDGSACATLGDPYPSKRTGGGREAGLGQRLDRLALFWLKRCVSTRTLIIRSIVDSSLWGLGTPGCAGHHKSGIGASELQGT